MQEEEEEDHSQQVEEDDEAALWVVQGCADSREPDVVAEGVAEHRPNEVPCREREEEVMSRMPPAETIENPSPYGLERELMWSCNRNGLG